MNRFIRTLSAILGCVVLPGCLVVQLNGHVGGAAVTVAPLNKHSDLQQISQSQSPQSIAASDFSELYYRLPPTAQLLWLGTVALPNQWEPDQLYLATAEGGTDYDSDRDLVIDHSPRPVQGTWRAIVPASALSLKTTKVSALTEAAYQWLLSVSDIPLQERGRDEMLSDLDRASRMVLDDVNGDGEVDYNDMLMWHPTINAGSFRGDTRHFDLMVTAITLGLDERLKYWAGTQLISGRGSRPTATESLANFTLGTARGN